MATEKMRAEWQTYYGPPSHMRPKQQEMAPDIPPWRGPVFRAASSRGNEAGGARRTARRCFPARRTLGPLSPRT
eukprot:1271207-Pyramimonas_sp.AAC.1